ncbi:Fic family protein [Notoacmeibacter sp. MSK16QG-6]|uniref:Fic/DOC family protein n=1 Tax=Notoacmeibacter sp. MSK16QG-6 TaxID=2957982 RepID=UPI0020A13924|nr:Fic family protein [Notoacmeibacter sp. MSK16QG-6]MCP1201064.1 Fic family protein [Notoacmeibacter sp. MSK16QG-6]
MAKAKGSYTYPNDVGDADHQDVLKNKLGLRSHSDLREVEYAATFVRQSEMELGQGPKGLFDETHLKAIHGYIFQDVYEWAGHLRNETVIVDGEVVDPIGNMSKSGDHFLHGSRIDMGLNEALRPIRDPDVLRGSTPVEFAEIAGRVMGEMNYVHGFRDGNGRTNQAFIAALGREYGHDVDFSLIPKPRMIDASRETSADPSSRAMVHLIEDATDPGRRAAIEAAFADLRQRGENPLEHDVRTVQAGAAVTGQVLGSDDSFVSLVTDSGIVVADRADLPADLPGDDRDITFTAHSNYNRLSMAQEGDRDASADPAAVGARESQNDASAASGSQSGHQQEQAETDDDRDR